MTAYEEFLVNQEIKKFQQELEIYKKAYNLLAKAYCDKGQCWGNCECRDICGTIDKFGVDITKELFLQKAREQE